MESLSHFLAAVTQSLLNGSLLLYLLTTHDRTDRSIVSAIEGRIQQVPGSFNGYFAT
jgi:hypothetical protein